MATYKVKSPLKHDGKHYAAGKSIKLDPKEATLIPDGVLEPVEDVKLSSNGNGSDIAKMTKAQIVEFAATKFSLTLDANLSKDDLIAAVAKADGEQK